jgi:PIN domain nuclease of toxin-antitoxin system
VRYLLDTHVWAWSLVEPKRLSKRALRVLEDASSEGWLSPISVWELSLLIERGRLEADLPAESWVREALRQTPLREASLNHEIALRSRSVQLPHADPADRFLVATAEVWELTLLTADQRLIDAGACRVLDCR